MAITTGTETRPGSLGDEKEEKMAASDKVLINLATGMEDAERVLVAFLVATAAQQQGKEVVVWATKDAYVLDCPENCKA